MGNMIVTKIHYFVQLLAYTSTIHPAILAHASRFVQQLQLAKPSKGRAGDPTAAKTGTDGYSSLGRVRLSQDRVQDLRNHLNNLGVLYDAKGNDMVPIIKQRQQATCIRLRIWKVVSKLPGTTGMQPT